MVDNASELKPEWLTGKNIIGITAGASAPEVLVRQVVEKLKSLGAERVDEVDGISEKVVFPLPKGLALRGPIAADAPARRLSD